MRRSLSNVARGEWLVLVRALVAVRNDAGLSQSELARRLGRRQSYIWKVENAQQRIDILEFFDICRSCHADPLKVAEGVIRDLLSSDQG